MKKQFSTLNESHLHKSLKVFYAARHNGQTEIQVEQWICDIVCPDSSIIEIQTKNVSSLHDKLQGLLALGRKVTVVHPVITQKKIATFDTSGKRISCRKSPKKESLYTMLRELTGLCDILLHKNFTLLCPFITVEERRTQTATPVKTKNGRRRFAKNWVKTDKALLTIGEEYKFYGKKDYLSLLPKALFTTQGVKNAEKMQEFSAKELAAALERPAKRYTNLTLWLLYHLGLIERTSTKNRFRYYRIK